MERSAMFGRHSALCQPSCSSRQHRTPADRVTTCVATPVKPPTAKVAKRYGCSLVTLAGCARASTWTFTRWNGSDKVHIKKALHQ